MRTVTNQKAGPSGTVEVTVERLVQGGLGLARTGRDTLLVSGALPGERVEVRIESRRGGATFARTERVIEPSPDRVEPPCPYYGRCGGCDFQHATYGAQVAAKSGIVADAIRRIAGVTLEEPPQVIESPKAVGYRLRAEWQVDPVAGRIGYFGRASHEVVDIESCLVLAPPVNDTLAALRAVPATEAPKTLHQVHATMVDDGVITDPVIRQDGAQEGRLTVDGISYWVRPRSFFQANAALLEPMLEEALWWAGHPAPPPPIDHDPEIPIRRTALDLYCGVGFFSIPLSRKFERVLAVDVDGRAIALARRSAREAGCTNLKFADLPIDNWLQQRARNAGIVELALLDPPRTGVERETLGRLLRIAPERITMISCDPATMARDLKVMLEAGYQIDRLRVIDLFPQTHHIETIVHLSLPPETWE